jgi:hypothetical protein
VNIYMFFLIYLSLVFCIPKVEAHGLHSTDERKSSLMKYNLKSLGSLISAKINNNVLKIFRFSILRFFF